MTQEMENLDKKYNSDLERKKNEHEDYLLSEKAKHEDKKG